MTAQTQTVPRWSLLVSRIFDPLVLISLTLVALIWYIHPTRWWWWLFFATINLGVPVGMMISLMGLGVIKSGWDIRRRQERIPIFMLSSLTQAITLFLTWSVLSPDQQHFLMTIFGLTLIYALITLFFKISVHVGVIVTLTTWGIILLSWWFAFGYALAALVLAARVAGGYHSLPQASLGYVLPVVVILSSYLLVS